MKARLFIPLLFIISCLFTQAFAGCGCGIYKNPELEKAKAIINPTKEDDSLSGVAYFEESRGGLKITVKVWNVSPGKHGLHIHEFGDTSNEGKAAGGHYNPERAPHGYAPDHNFFVAHPGDLGNIEVNEEGIGELEVFVPKLKLTKGKYTVSGRSIILHEKEDDFSQPTGNAGSRIGAGTIFLVDNFN
ncbi:MAG: superoxide dismutase family protein [Chlamydiales bacterium]|nr:superoxide dismutase family protein [Chlamydiales bacterium]